MASDNMAVDVLDVDAMSVHEMEAGLGSSRIHLIQQMEEEKPPSVRQSIQKSLTKSVRKARFYISIMLAPFKYIIMKFKLLILIVLYSCFGAWLFRTLEVPHDLATKEEAYHARLIARDVMILNLRAIHLENKEDRENRWKDAVMQFEADIGLDEPSVDTVWTFWMAFLYAGYGNIACQTRSGQIATVVYAFIGIPITLVLLNGLGDFLLKLTKVSAGVTSDLFLFAGVRWGFIALEEGSERRKRYLVFCHKLSKAKLLPAPSHDEDDEVEHDPPVFPAIILTIIVMVASAGIFSMLEGWDFFTSWYFFFISCSTIGLGDVVPSKPEFMILALGVMFVGLAMITVCFNVIQEKMEQLYMKMLRKLVEDYMKAVENNDPNATAGMMAGFQGKAKFLMPLMSKNMGANAMEKFKKKCAEEGIEPPPVLTNINPDTGMPAFATANKESFSDFIEQAEEKQAEDRRLAEERVQSRQSNQPEVRVSTVPVIDVCIQAEIGPVFAPRPDGATMATQTTPAPDRSFGAQFTPISNDIESQTTQSISVDEGIQTWLSCEEVSVQYDAISFTTTSSQYDMPELTANTAVGGEPKTTTCTAIQPEVSMFAVSDDSEYETTDTELSEEESDTLEEKLNNLQLPTIQRLRKSVSEESQDTVISVSPSMSPTSRRKKLEEKKASKKKKMRAEGLRFMKHSADQTSVEVINADCQTEQYSSSVMAVQCQAETSEQSLQYSLTIKGRRCQTKITCIPMEKRNLGITRQTSAKGVKKPFLSQPSNISTASSVAQSAASYEGLVKHPSLQSISESDVVHSEGDSEAGEVANLDVSYVSKPVDEEGMIVMETKAQYYVDEPSIAESEMTSADIEDDIFDSEDDLFDDEMEPFVFNECTQTDSLILEDIETQATVSDLDIMREVLCQTELSSFRMPTKVVEIVPQPVDQGKLEEKEMRETEATAKAEEVKPVLPEDVTIGLMETSVQTTQTMVFIEEQGPDDITATEECGVQYLVSTGCNPELESATVECQTDIQQPQTSTIITTVLESSDASGQTEKLSEIHVSTQADYDKTDMTTQVELIMEEQEIQACVEMAEGDTQVIINNEEIAIQVEDFLGERTECIGIATDPRMDTSEAETSTTVATAEVETATAVETLEAESQTAFPTSHTAIQPINEFCSPRGAQAKVDAKEIETQMDFIWTEVEAQTDADEPIPTSNVETQTEPKKVKRKETSVSTKSDTKSAAAAAVKEHAPTGIDATVPMVSTQAQSDVSMFIVDPADRSKLEVEHNVRFNVNSTTWMEEKRQKHIGTQKEPNIRSSTVQVRPNLVTSQTQYVFSCASDQHSQTEIMTKNKRSQKVDASSLAMNTGMETDDIDLPPVGAVLWSDFDPILEEYDEEAQSEASQFSHQAYKEVLVETESDSIAQEQPGKKMVITYEAGCSAIPQMEDLQTQATIEMETKASGNEEPDDWVKVYIQELDEERRLRMFDIGIQTGVLARVQHMYGKKEVTTEEGGNVDILKVSLRKTDSTETLSKSKKNDGSEESLSHASSVRSIAESVDDNPTTWPSSSRPKTEIRRSASVRKPAKKKEQMKGDVAETIRRFERKNAPEQKRPRSSSSER